ncbi:MAG: TlyA family rRNA (cytidine-2'-O)-methyltransferase [Phycisphaerae bacterium]|nr:TlyA family rRNA (cytidine-2'-O)-methyltransferase [Phycisphaerae bacterium]
MDHVDEPNQRKFVSRGGLKLAHALDSFGLDVTGLTCADLGSSTGGFCDCLLQAGAAHVHSVDTAYGELAWTIRNDPRVTVMERTNALHAVPPGPVCELVTIDLGWTPQHLALPAALPWLSTDGRVITLVKPHYEPIARDRGWLVDGVVATDHARAIAEEIAGSVQQFGFTCLDQVASPVTGRKSGRRSSGGNTEFLLLLRALQGSSDHRSGANENG